MSMTVGRDGKKSRITSEEAQSQPLWNFGHTCKNSLTCWIQKQLFPVALQLTCKFHGRRFQKVLVWRKRFQVTSSSRYHCRAQKTPALEAKCNKVEFALDFENHKRERRRSPCGCLHCTINTLMDVLLSCDSVGGVIILHFLHSAVKCMYSLSQYAVVVC